MLSIARQVVVLTTVVVLGFGAQPVMGQDTKKPRRLAYVVQHSTALRLAKALEGRFGKNLQALPDAFSNTLLLSAPESTLDEAVKALGELDRPGRMVVLEIVLLHVARTKAPDGKLTHPEIDLAQLQGKADGVAAYIQAMQEKGVFPSPQRFTLATVENQTIQVSNQRSQPFTTGMSMSKGAGGKGMSSSIISYKETGTVITATVRIHPGDLVGLDLKFDDSFAHQPHDGIPLGMNDRGEQVMATEFGTFTFKSGVQVASGTAIVATAIQSQASSDVARKLLVVTAKVLP